MAVQACPISLFFADAGIKAEFARTQQQYGDITDPESRYQFMFPKQLPVVHIHDHEYRNNQRYRSQAGKQAQDQQQRTEELGKGGQSQRCSGAEAHKAHELAFPFCKVRQLGPAMVGDHQ